MKRIEKLHESLRFDRVDVCRIVEAQINGVVETYTLTTMSTLNGRRDTNTCLWCGKVQSINHDCESKPDYNCWFTFGEEGEGVAFVKVSRYGLQHGEEHVLQNDALDPGAHNMFDEMSEPKTFVSPVVELFSTASKVFDELPLPDFIKELAETSRGIELNPIGGDYDYTSSVHEAEDDHSSHMQPLFAKLDVSEGLYRPGYLHIMQGEYNLLASTDVFSELAYSKVRNELVLVPNKIVLVPNKIAMVSFNKSIVLNLIQLDFALTSPTWKHVFGKVLNEISHNIVLSRKFVLTSPDVLPKLNKFIVGQDWRDSIEITSWLPFHYYGIIRHCLVTMLEHDNSDYIEEEILYFRRLGLDRFEVALFHVFVHVRYDKVVSPIKSNQWSTWAQRIYCNRLGARGSYKYFDPGICMLLFHTLTLEDKGDFMGDGMVIENGNDLGENGVVNHDKGDNLEDVHDTAISTSLKESKHAPFSLSPRMSNNKLYVEAVVEAATEFLNKVVKPVIVAGLKLRVANKKDVPISMVAYSLVVLTLDESKEANSHLLSINLNGLYKAVKARDAIFVSQYLFTGSESTSVWLEVSEVKGNQDELHLVDCISGTIQRRTWHEDTKRCIMFWTTQGELCDQLKRRAQQPGIRVDFLLRVWVFNPDTMYRNNVLEVVEQLGYIVAFISIASNLWDGIMYWKLSNGHQNSIFMVHYVVTIVCACFQQHKVSKSEQNVTMARRVFDPGGYDSEPTMTKRPQVYPYGAKRKRFRRREDYQSYVFDPGGSLVLQDHKSVRLWRMEGVMSFILEDKDNFKGSVMIHTEY